MNTPTNPFSPPTVSDNVTKPRKKLRRFHEVLVVAWPFVFGANMIVPLLFGRNLIENRGSLGMALAAIMLLLAGWMLFVVWPPLAYRLSLGSIVTALLQFFPLLHLFAGLIAFAITVNLGLAVDATDFSSEEVTSELGGFVITAITGSCLLLFSLGVGTFVFIFTDRKEVNHLANESE